MICPRWTPRTTATLACLSGSSRQGSSSRQIPVRYGDSELKRGFSTSRGDDEDGSAGPPSREPPQPFHNAQQPSSRPTQTFFPLLRRRTRPATAGDTSMDWPKSSTDRPPRYWTGRGGSDAESESSATSPRGWLQLRRRARGGRQGDEGVGNAALAISKLMFPPRQNVQNPQGTKDSSQIMLVIDGLSPNLSATDFYRLTPNDLSDWQSAIRKVQLQRNPHTLEPLGRYLVTFSTAQAAATYRDRLVQLHKLNGFKLRSASGLWESSVPLSLKVSLASASAAASAASAAATEARDEAVSDVPTTEGVADLVDTFTIAPGSQAVLPVQRKRVLLLRPWAKRLAGLVENLGYGERPSILMVEIYPPTLTAEELHRFIRRDGRNRGLGWRVSIPLHLKMNSPEQGFAKVRGKEAYKREMDKHNHDEVALDKRQSPSFTLNDRETWEKLKGRFVFACADEAEARRFQQSWNHRALITLGPQPARYVVHASIINW
ncbi:hypothetical protein V8C37DRAFT_387837 [Trichoderma ceciliae]